MKIKDLFLIITILLCSNLFTMNVNAEKQNNYRLASHKYIEHIVEIKNEYQSIYEASYQNKLLDEIEKIKKEKIYDIDDLLLIKNPFKTNAIGVYIYFNTEQLTTVEYTIHVDDKEIKDFTATLNNGQNNNLALEHEYQLIGLVPGRINNITLSLKDAHGNIYCKKQFNVEMEQVIDKSYVKLEKEYGESPNKLTNGLFTVLGDEFKDIYMYELIN